MSNRIKTAVSDISFVEMAKVVQSIEVQAALVQIPDTAVSSFYLGKLGLDNLIRRKYNTLHDLVQNKSRLTVFIGSSDYPLDGDVAIVATSMLTTFEDMICGLKEQISRAVRLGQYEQTTVGTLGIARELEDEEIPY